MARVVGRPALAETMKPTAQVGARPLPIPAAEAGARGLGGWIAPGGKFYYAARNQHIRVAELLRNGGGGPTEPWQMRDGWVMVRSTGEVVSLPGLSQSQWDALGDMLVAAPGGGYRSWLLQSMRQLRELEAAAQI